jgi:hypothetical protein
VSVGLKAKSQLAAPLRRGFLFPLPKIKDPAWRGDRWRGLLLTNSMDQSTESQRCQRPSATASANRQHSHADFLPPQVHRPGARILGKIARGSALTLSVSAGPQANNLAPLHAGLYFVCDQQKIPHRRGHLVGARKSQSGIQASTHTPTRAVTANTNFGARIAARWKRPLNARGRPAQVLRRPQFVRSLCGRD